MCLPQKHVIFYRTGTFAQFLRLMGGTLWSEKITSCTWIDDSNATSCVLSYWDFYLPRHICPESTIYANLRGNGLSERKAFDTHVKYTCPCLLDGACQISVAWTLSFGSACVIELHSGMVWVLALCCHSPIHSLVWASRAWMKKPRKTSPPDIVTEKKMFNEQIP